MSDTHSKLAEIALNVCAGTLPLLVATPIAVAGIAGVAAYNLFSFGKALKNKCAVNSFAAAQAKMIKNLKSLDFDDDDFRLATQLIEKTNTDCSQEIPTFAALAKQGGDLSKTAASHIISKLDKTHATEGALKIAQTVLVHGLSVCLAKPEIKQSLTQEVIIEIAVDLGAMYKVVETVDTTTRETATMLKQDLELNVNIRAEQELNSSHLNKYIVILEAQTETLQQEISVLKRNGVSGNAEQIALLQSQLNEYHSRHADPERALEEAQDRIKFLEESLALEDNKIEHARMSNARTALEQGDFRLADQIFKDISDQEEMAVDRSARAFFARGQIAEDQVRWAKAAELYRRSAELKPCFKYAKKAHEYTNWAGDYKLANIWAVKSRDFAAKEFSRKSAEYAFAENDYAITQRDLGEFGVAKKSFLKALRIRKALHGEVHKDVAISLNNLADIYRVMGDYPSAEPMYKQAIAIDKATIGEEHPSYAISLNNLADLYRVMGDYPSAEPLYKQAIAIDKATIGEEHPNYAISLSNLAILYRDIGDYPSAEPLYKQAIAIDKATIGEHHPDYAISLNNLAGLYYAMGDYPSAEPLLKQAMAIGKAALGENHPSYAIRLNNLAELHRAMGDYPSAEPLYKQAIAIGKATIGKDHPDFATRLNNLAGLYHAKGDYPSAEPLYKQAIAISQNTLPPDHPQTKKFKANFAAMQAALDKG